MPRLALLPLAATLLFAAGCGSGGSGGDSQTPSTADASQTTTVEEKPTAMRTAAKPPTERPATGTKIKVVDSDFGRVIADRKGEALYLFDREDRGKSECYGECARVWPPVLSKGRPQAAAGAKQRLLGTTRRASGKLQVTYAGQPLYYYVDDSPGQILCNDVEEFGGLWLVVDPRGRPNGA